MVCPLIASSCLALIDIDRRTVRSFLFFLYRQSRSPVWRRRRQMRVEIVCGSGRRVSRPVVWRQSPRWSVRPLCCEPTSKKKARDSIDVRSPGPRCAAPMEGIVQALYACLPGRCPVLGEERVGGCARADLSALQLPALRRTSADLSPLRSRQYLLRAGVFAHSPARVPAPCRGALSAHAPRSVASRRPATGLAGAAADSDASGIPWGRALSQRIGPSDHGGGTDRCVSRCKHPRNKPSRV